MSTKQFINYTSKLVLFDNPTLINKNNRIVWYNINKDGYIQKSSEVLNNQAAIYIYIKNYVVKHAII